MKYAQEYGRVTAEKIERFNRDLKTLHTIWLPQFELITYDPAEGTTIRQNFVCIEDKNNTSGIAECEGELEALQCAIGYRDKLKSE